MIDLSASSGQQATWYADAAAKAKTKAKALGADLSQRVNTVAQAHLASFAVLWASVTLFTFVASGTGVAIGFAAIGTAIVWRAWRSTVEDGAGVTSATQASAIVGAVSRLCVEYEIGASTSVSVLTEFNTALKLLLDPHNIQIRLSRFEQNLLVAITAREQDEGRLVDEVVGATMSHLRDVAVVDVCDGTGLSMTGLSSLLAQEGIRYALLHRCAALSDFVAEAPLSQSLQGIAITDCGLRADQESVIEAARQRGTCVLLEKGGDARSTIDLLRKQQAAAERIKKSEVAGETPVSHQATSTAEMTPLRRWLRRLDFTADGICALSGAYLMMQVPHYIQSYNLVLGGAMDRSFGYLQREYGALQSFQAAHRSTPLPMFSDNTAADCVATVDLYSKPPAAINKCELVVGELRSCYQPLSTSQDVTAQVTGALWLDSANQFMSMAYAKDALDNGPVFARPIALARHYDKEIGARAWKDFKWGHELTLESVGYGLAGVVLGVGAYYTLTAGLKWFARGCLDRLRAARKEFTRKA